MKSLGITVNPVTGELQLVDTSRLSTLNKRPTWRLVRSREGDKWEVNFFTMHDLQDSPAQVKEDLTFEEGWKWIMQNLELS